MISSKKQLKFYIFADRVMNGFSEHRSIREMFQNCLGCGGIIHFLYLMRMYDYYLGRKGPVNKFFCSLYSFRYKRMGLKLGFSINPQSFGYGLVIPHYGTIVVGKNRIGNYAVMHTSTCITSQNSIIGDGLYLSTGAKIISSVKLGDFVSVGANAIVNKSFDESNILVVGIPPFIKKKTDEWWNRDRCDFKNRHDIVENKRKVEGL